MNPGLPWGNICHCSDYFIDILYFCKGNFYKPPNFGCFLVICHIFKRSSFPFQLLSWVDTGYRSQAKMMVAIITPYLYLYRWEESYGSGCRKRPVSAAKATYDQNDLPYDIETTGRIRGLSSLGGSADMNANFLTQTSDTRAAEYYCHAHIINVYVFPMR